MIINLDRALNRGRYKQTGVIIMGFERFLTRYHTGGYNCTNYRLLEDLLTSGSANGSLSALKKWCWMVKPRIQSRSYQVPVPQPVPFRTFINDLPEDIRSSVRLFADDRILYMNIKPPIDCQILQDDLNSLKEREPDWQMKFNVAKCKTS